MLGFTCSLNHVIATFLWKTPRGFVRRNSFLCLWRISGVLTFRCVKFNPEIIKNRSTNSVLNLESSTTIQWSFLIPFSAWETRVSSAFCTKREKVGVTTNTVGKTDVLLGVVMTLAWLLTSPNWIESSRILVLRVFSFSVLSDKAVKSFCSRFLSRSISTLFGAFVVVLGLL